MLSIHTDPPAASDDTSIFVDARALCPPGAEGDDRLGPALVAVRRLADAGVTRFDVLLPEGYPAERAAFLLRTRAAQRVVGATPWTPQAPRIETPRLTLTYPTAAQMRGYYDAIVGTSIFETLIWEGPDDPESLPDYWLRVSQTAILAPADDVHLSVVVRDSGAVAGGISLRRKGPDGCFDVGYAFAPAFHGQGYATEAVGALVDFAFREHAVERIYSDIFVGNHASRRVVEKLGFTLEGTLERAVEKRGVWIDEWMLSLVRPRWLAREEGRRRT